MPLALKWQRTALSLGLIAVISGVVLRFVAPSPLWLDEALSVNIARLDFGDLVEALRHDGHPALYYLLLGWWIDAFGDSDAAVRSLSGAFSVGSLWLIYRIALRSERAIAPMALLVAASSPFLVRYATEARMYALLTFLCCLGWLFTERAIERPSLGRLVPLALTTAALVHTHYWSIWLVAAALTVVGFNVAFGPVAMRATTVRIGVAIVAGSATFFVWWSVFYEQLGTTGTPWADRARPAEVVIETIQAIGGNNRFEGELLGVVLLVVAVIGVLGVRGNGHELVLRFSVVTLNRGGLCALLTLGIGGTVAAINSGAFEARYAALVVAFVLVMTAKGIAVLPPRPRMLVLWFVVLFGFAVSVDEARRDRTQGADVAALINEGFAEGDVVVYCPDQVGPATQRGIRGSPSSFAFPRGDGDFVDWQHYRETIAETSVDRFVADLVNQAENNIWLVSGFGYKGFDDRCQTIGNELARTHQPQQLLAPSDVFEPMLLTRFEAPQ